MKWSAYILLLVNLGLFVWHYQPNVNMQRNQVSDQLTRLVLLKESEQQLKLAAHVSAAPRCYSLGPFTYRQSFNAAKEKMSHQGVEVFSRESSEHVRNGYWVMLPVSATSNQTKMHLQKLKVLGVKDYFLVAAGEEKNAISLGVFSKPKLAKRRRDEVEKLGFKVNVKKTTLPKRVYWLEWPSTSEHQPDKIFLDKLLTQFKGIGQTERRCPSSKK